MPYIHHSHSTGISDVRNHRYCAVLPAQSKRRFSLAAEDLATISWAAASRYAAEVVSFGVLVTCLRSS